MRKMNFKRKSKKRYRLNILSDVDTDKDDLVRSPNVANMSFNVDVSKGVLKKTRSLGTSYLNTPYCDKGKYVTYYDKGAGYLVIITEDGRVKWYEKNANGTFGNRKVSTALFTSTPKSLSYTLNGENVMFFSDKEQGLFIWKGEGDPEKLENAPLIKNMIVHNERLFVTVQNDPYTLWFSDDLDPTNWNVSLTGAGFIKFADERGKLLNIISFGGYLYLFREYGISRLNAYGEQTDFSITHLFTPSGRIYEDTVVLCGDRIMFGSSEGIFTFDGANAIRVLTCLDDYFKVIPTSCAGFYEGKYYIASYKIFDDESFGAEDSPYSVHTCLLEYHVFTKKFIMHRGMDIRLICPVRNFNVVFVDCDNNLCIVDNYDNDLIGDMNLGDMNEYFDFYGMWRMPFTDLGIPDEEKYLESIVFNCTGSAEVIVKTETDTVSVKVDASPFLVEIPIHLTGKVFSVAFKLIDRYMQISKPTLIFY